jgi:putative Holliday junction resolvase
MPRNSAIDYGQKRTGIAVTDEMQIIASGLTTIPVQLPFPLKDYFSKEKVEVLLGAQANEWAAIRKCFYNKRFVTHFTNHFPDMKVIRR